MHARRLRTSVMSLGLWNRVCRVQVTCIKRFITKTKQYPRTRKILTNSPKWKSCVSSLYFSISSWLREFLFLFQSPPSSTTTATFRSQELTDWREKPSALNKMNDTRWVQHHQNGNNNKRSSETDVIISKQSESTVLRWMKWFHPLWDPLCFSEGQRWKLNKNKKVKLRHKMLLVKGRKVAVMFPLILNN